MWTLKVSEPLDQKLLDQVESAYEAFMGRSDLGFLRPDLVDKALESIRGHQSFLNQKKHLAVIGLGGSSLGTKVLCEALAQEPNKIHFLDNVDPHSVDQWLQGIKPEQWAWLMVSKSGDTMEVLALYDHCAQWIKSQKGFSIKEQTGVITERKNSEVYKAAQKYGWPVFELPQDVGGRFSVFTPVGLLPSVFLKISPQGLMEGRLKALSHREEVMALVGSLWASHRRGEKILYSFQYCERLQAFGRWLQQLWSESLGKKQSLKAEAAATFIPCRGVSDQHSLLQQIMEGAEKKFVCFHRVMSSETSPLSLENSVFDQSPLGSGSLGRLMEVEAQATCQALNQSQIHTLVLKTEDITESSLAYLMMCWMIGIGVLGELLGVNAFDQPGVELGKKISRQVLTEAD